MLDVIVQIFKNGLLINGHGAGGNTTGTTAALGNAVIGKMKLGKA